MESGKPALNSDSATLKCVTVGQLLNLSEPQFLHLDPFPCPQGPKDRPLPNPPAGFPTLSGSSSKLQPHLPSPVPPTSKAYFQGLCTGTTLAPIVLWMVLVFHSCLRSRVPSAILDYIPWSRFLLRGSNRLKPSYLLFVWLFLSTCYCSVLPVNPSTP